MGAKTDFEPLTWEEAEQNRKSVHPTGMQLAENKPIPPRSRESLPVSFPGIPAERTLRRRASVEEECDRLRTEIKRGIEYLEAVQREVSESRSLIEEWPYFEKHCGTDPLAHLMHGLMANERIANFLVPWIKRREDRLTALARRIETGARVRKGGGTTRAAARAC